MHLAPGSKFTKDPTKLEPSSPPGEISPEPHRGAGLDLAGTSQANSRYVTLLSLGHRKVTSLRELLWGC